MKTMVSFMVLMCVVNVANADSWGDYDNTVKYWNEQRALLAAEQIARDQATQTRIMQHQQYVPQQQYQPQQWQQPRGLDPSIILRGNWNN